MVNYIVSGCPRSGTSMTMRILAKSGMDIASDEKRDADSNNIHGYFEVESIVNKLKDNPEIIKKFEGQVLKVIHYGLQYLPESTADNYKILYIERNMKEVMMSMEKMMGKEDPNREETQSIFTALNEKVKSEIRQRPDVKVLFINHRELVLSPEPVVEKIIEFFNIDPSKKQGMLSAIDPNQYRNRVE